MTTIDPTAFDEIIEELSRQPLQENKYRNVAGSGKSQAFGVVGRRCLKPDYSRQCWMRPKLFFHLIEFANKYVTIPWSSITVNQNYKSLPHKDKHNKGLSYIVGFGSYTGGNLKIHEGPLEGSHSIRHTPITHDFSKVIHSTEDWEGDRYSLVFYDYFTPRLESLPPPSVKKEGSTYLFYRGDELITRKKGLPHPLKDRKKPVLVKEQREIEIEFK